MFKIVWTPSEATGDNPLTDTLFLHRMEVQTFTADRVLPTLAMSIVSSK